MAFVFEMPEVGEGVVEAEVAEWKVAVGDTVAVDQPLCEITTDKASLEVSSPKAGVIVKLYGEPGDIVGVHTPLCEIDTSGAAAAAPAEASPEPAAKASAPAPAPATPAPAAPAAPVPAPSPTNGVPRAAPAVRKHAQELGVDLRSVAGTGHRGRITHDDLTRAPAPAAAPLPIAPRALPMVDAAPDDQRVKIMGIRRKIAERMVAAKHTAPHFTYVEEIDCTALVELRGKLKARAAEYGVKLTYMPIFAKAVSSVMRQFPNVNAVMDEAESTLVVKGRHHFGFACDTPNGLMVPVIRDVQAKSLLHLAAEMQDLFGRAREGKATRDELSGSTFTITSVGSIGGVLATPILNVPEVAILGLNQIKRRPVVLDDGSIVARHMTYVSPSFDHRIIDGAVAARFIAALKDVLEHPERLFLEMV